MKTFPLELVTEAYEESTGFCVECGAEGQCAEPDAEKYRCDECGKPAVYGAGNIAVMGLIST